MTYCTAPFADLYALEKGAYEFLSLDDKGATCLANGAATASQIAIPFDTLSTASFIAVNDLLQVGAEVLRVLSVTYDPGNLSGTLTVERGLYGTTAATIADDTVFMVKTYEKIRLLAIATDDITNYHKQILSGGELWYAGSDDLQRACAAQALYLSKFLAARDTGEFIRNVSGGSYSDTVISIGSAASRQLDPVAQALIDNVLVLAGVGVGEFTRA